MLNRSNITSCIAVILFSVILLFNAGCRKYLDARTDKSLVVITDLRDLQSILDRYLYVNQKGLASLAAGGDNYYAVDASWGYFSDQERNMYTWKGSDLFPDFGSSGNEWSLCYDNVYRANTVLDNIVKIKRTPDNHAQWDDIKGQACFLRAKSFLQAAWVWALAYDSASAATDLGIPLRLNADFNERSARASVQQTYDRIIKDLKTAVSLLPEMPVHVMRASKPAAYGLLARTYLSMRRYDKAGLYADSCLQLRNRLMNYNGDEGVNPVASVPFMQFNPEIIFEETMLSNLLIHKSLARIDSLLYRSYSEDDLRKTVFFKMYGDGSIGFKGFYSGTNQFCGIATDEAYLMRAESYARAGNTNDAMKDLNTLLSNRWKSGTFIPFTASTPGEALKLILSERRKELLYRGLRWMDIKRLNKEGANIIQRHIINGQTYILPANDLRYAMPIPEQVIDVSGMRQNPR